MREAVLGIVLSDGSVVGTHKGIIHYTVGQRKGLGLSMGHPVFVLEIRPDTNEIVVGTGEESLTRKVRHAISILCRWKICRRKNGSLQRSGTTTKGPGVRRKRPERMRSYVSLTSLREQSLRGRRWYFMTENMFWAAERS